MLTTKEISNIISGKLEGNPDIEIYNIERIDHCKQGNISFIANEKYLKYLDDSKASAIVIGDNLAVKSNKNNIPLIRVANVYAAVTTLLKLLEKGSIENNGISQMSYISSNASIEENVSIGAFSYVSDFAKIGANTLISTQVFIGKDVVIGNNVKIYPGVKIYNGCKIGNNCIIHANTVIGSDGFGFKPDEKGVYEKVPQVGIVTIKDNVEIGANTVIDRATFGETVIHDGVKLDNLIQVAHNVEIGKNTVIAAQSGIAGSTELGENIICGGQVGFGDHLKIANGSKFQGKTGILQNIKQPNKSFMGTPAIDYNNHVKSFIVFKKLPELQKKILELEKQIEKINKSLGK
ncbi:MAG TPA: UDP-3-O-(3-hydroxymyristoyl)glucosamine N-acyltransferase [Bacteroidetes bacterium]|nr:UDP-3-O-(3-hydroxymyristoyl)glucosamine N-acyltransferase [Bacteroidota bacterium]